MKKAPRSHPESLRKALESLRKDYGDAVLMEDGDTATSVSAVPTGCYALDGLLGCGGLPRGRIVEVFGQESSGKTTLALFLAGQMQKKGLRAVLVDAEHAYDPKYSASLGVNTKDLMVAQPQTLEEAMDIVRVLTESNEVDLIIVDSVAALVPKKELENDEMLKDSVAEQARLLSKALRIITGSVARSKSIVIFINQLRDNIGVMYGNKQITPGGKALKFYSSVRIQVNKGDKIKGPGDSIIGNTVNVKAVKNKVGFPYKEAQFDLYYGGGVDLVADAFDVACDFSIITKEGTTYSFGGEKLAVGRDATIKKIRENPDTFVAVKEAIDAKISATSTVTSA